MINQRTLIRTKLESTFNRNQAQVLSEVIADAYSDLVKTGDFNELKAIVKRLAEAQERTDTKIDKLAEAQEKTNSKVDKLAETMGKLAEAQKRTELRMEDLTDSIRLLTKSQERTEQVVKTLVTGLIDTRKQLGGLSATVGYSLENQSYKMLPELLKRDFGITLKDRLKRQYVIDKKGREIEINIIGHGTKDGEEIVIIGESKSNLSHNKIDKFVESRLLPMGKIFDNILPLMVTHMTSSSYVDSYAKEKGITLYFSYDLS